MKCIRHDCGGGGGNVPPNKGPGYVSDTPSLPRASSFSVLGQFTGEETASVDSCSHPLQTILRLFHPPPPPVSLPMRVTWRSPSPPPPRMRVSGPRRAAREPDAPRPGRGALVLRTVRSFPRRNRSSRTRGGCGDRSRAPVRVWWWDGGPVALWRWRWWRWCVTPSARSCMCYCRSELSVWSPAPGSSCSRTF